MDVTNSGSVPIKSHLLAYVETVLLLSRSQSGDDPQVSSESTRMTRMLHRKYLRLSILPFCVPSCFALLFCPTCFALLVLPSCFALLFCPTCFALLVLLVESSLYHLGTRNEGGGSGNQPMNILLHLQRQQQTKKRRLSDSTSSVSNYIDPNAVSFSRILLLSGPPGCGKSSLAKGMAQKVGIRFWENYRGE